MTRSLRTALVLFLVCGLGAPGGAEIYRWVDASGHEHFSSRLSDVPPAQRDAAEQGAGQRGRVNVVESVRPAPEAKPAPAAPAPAAGEKIGGSDEAGWRARAAKLRSDIGRLEQAVAECKDSAPVRWKPGGGSRRDYQNEVSEAESCQRRANDLGYARLQLEKLAENAHELGIPPGWVR